MSILLEDFKKTKKDFKVAVHDGEEILEELEDERDVCNLLLSIYTTSLKAEDSHWTEEKSRRS